MSAHLHSRKKPLHYDVEDPPAPHSGGDGKLMSVLKSSKRPGRIKRCGKASTELQWALTAVGWFLLVGFFVSYLVTHQHHTTIMHVLRDPVGHGQVLRGRAGFRHHFYTGSPRFVTVVMPSVVNPDGRIQRLDAIQDTWGQGARAIYVVHNVTEFPEASHAVISDSLKPQDPYAYPQLLLLPPNIRIDKGLPRLYHTVRTIYERVNPDFAFFVNDHTFVIPEHLCKYLEETDPLDHMYAGHALVNRQNKDQVFNSGAAGYVLSRSTMQKLVEKWDAKDETCWQGEDAPNWIQGNPGLALVKCLNSFGVFATDTRAQAKWHRFHAFPLTRVVSGKVDDWYNRMHERFADVDGFDESYSRLLEGPDCCSRSSISFHYVERKEAKALFAVREALLKYPHMSDHELKSMMIKEWPHDFKEIGGYSRGLPKETDQEGWRHLLAVVRKISGRDTQRDC